MENRHKLTLDFKHKPITAISFKQNDIDADVLEVSIKDNGIAVDLTDQTIEFAFLKPDKTLVVQDSTTGVFLIDAEGGKIQCVLKSNTLAAVGTVQAEIIFSLDGKRLTSLTFSFNVTASLDNGEGTPSTNEIPKIDAKIAEMDTAMQEIVNARHDNITNTDYANAGARMDAHSSQLAEIVTVNVKKYGAKGDGITDDTQAFRDAYNALPSNGGTIFLPKPAVKYRLSGAGASIATPIITLNIQKDNVHIYSNGDTTILMDDFTLADANANTESNGDDIFTVFLFNGVKNCSIRNINFEGLADGVTPLDLPRARAKAIGITDCENIKVSKVRGYRIVGNTVNARGKSATSKYIDITDSYAEGCSENGFNYMGNTMNCHFSNNISINNGFQGLESGADYLTCIGNTFIGNKNGVSHVGRYSVFKGNIIYANRLNGFNFQYNTSVFNGSYNDISGNIITNNPQTGIISSGGCHDNNIDNNYIVNNGDGLTIGEGIKLQSGISNIKITNNYIANVDGSTNQLYGINVTTGTNIFIKQNYFKGHINFSILTQSGGDNHIITDNYGDKDVSLSGTTTNIKLFDNQGSISNRIIFVAPSFLNGWADYSTSGGSSRQTGYWIDRDGFVNIRGIIKSGTSGQAAFNLPVGYRPTKNEEFAVVANGIFAWVQIAVSGNVIVTSTDITKVSLSGIRFRAE